jgi:RNA polymerase sigma-70 factor (ECF subfamily)
MPGGEPERGTRQLTPLHEMQLLEGARAGDRDALAELLRAYQQRLFGVCYRMLRDSEAAADLTQEALVKIIEGLDRYDGRSQLSTWMIRVTMNACLSHLRKRRHRRHASLDEPTGPAGETRAARLAEPSEHSGSWHVEQSETRAVLADALERLDPQMRAILVLRDLQELEYQQIAEVLDLPIGTVKSRLFRARAALRQAVEGALGDEEHS